jgi:ectoine hydroxylase-related dioxygenase (phytanoyl-CoA dioxygenase family)
MPRLSEADLASYRERGFFLARGLFSRAELLPVLSGIDALLCAKLAQTEAGRGVVQSSPAAVFDEIHGKVMLLKETDRNALAAVYDAIRKLTPFWSLVGSSAMSEVVSQLLDATHTGVAFRGAGIRLDIPGEDKWRSAWHQEYHSQMSALNAVVAWFNLVAVSHDMGPVRMAEGSHKQGLLPVRCHDPMNTGKDYTQTFEILDVESIASRYPQVSFETEIGDVVFLSFLLLHESGKNVSQTNSRITCQVRYFDMNDETAIRHDWKGGWQEGGDFTKLHPEKVLP